MRANIFFILICSIILGVGQLKAQTVANVALSHNGKVTIYNADALEEALGASVDGDSLFLSKGSFPSCTISKKISMIGAGQSTIVNGITVKTTGVLTSRMLDAMQISNNLNISPSTTLDGFCIRKCSAATITGFSNLTNVLIDRCCFSSFVFNYYPTKMRVVNSIVGNSSYTGSQYSNYSNINSMDDILFVNCNVRAYTYYTSYSLNGTFINCIVSQSHIGSKSYFSYCFHSANIDSNRKSNCVQGSYSENVAMWSPNMTGSDGTPVGITGGTTPYTLAPSGPEIESYDLNVDTQNRKLNVNIKMAVK